MNDLKKNVAVVDDDQGTREFVADLLKTVGLVTQSYPNGEEFLKKCPVDEIGCGILDLRMPGLSGLDVQRELSSKGEKTPIVMISGYGDVPEVVEAMRLGAVSFLQKPIRPQELLDRVHEALKRDTDFRRATRRNAEMKKRIESMTRREKEVLNLLLVGKTAKEAASQLGIATKTVDYHRAQILEKMQVHTMTELMALMMSCCAFPESRSCLRYIKK